MINRSLQKLQSLLLEIKSNITNKNIEDTNISKATVGWHLDHSLKVFNVVCEVLAGSNPNEYKSKFNTTRWLIFTLGSFPRGKVKAPKKVVSENISISDKDLHEQLEHAKTALSIIKTLDPHAYFKHHIFGNLSKKQTMRFLEIHTNHHLKIVQEILRSHRLK
ncbi:DinB family protein [Pseudotamlana agarivorans]|uniref:DinB family protein n=1 Tax=Pseudotamlana agarivorans TaxID=481183 RepID=UPI000833E1C0|nr:DinB family protein [Tamlana agarivorans]